ncbi:MAG: TIGR00159 family protein [Lachnospiraceae bacterium]|nr:TIGR00159 family protein [Lachnospiraceae bacterium]
MEAIKIFFEDYLVRLSLPKLKITDIIEILIIACFIYNLIKWVKRTRAWALMRGLAILLVFWIIASIFRFNAIIWIFVNAINVGIIAIVVLFQPEFRKALEQLGQRSILSPLVNFADTKDETERFSDHTIEELVRATFELAKTKTGALMVIEGEVSLDDYERTGIEVDAVISSQLLINIFEHNTPLHDGAVTIRGNRVTAATCYLPLSDSMSISKELGTRHRAGLGISEVTDSFTIIVSEETGKVSIAKKGQLIRSVDSDYLRAKLIEIQKKTSGEIKKRKLWKGRSKNETGVN